MKKTLKNLIGLMLVFALLIVPATNTAMAASIQLEGNKYIDGGGIFADLIIPNPAYTEQENLYPNVSNEGSSTRSQTLTNGIYRIKNAFNGKYMDTNGGGTTAGTAIVQWDKSEYYGGTTTVNPNQLFKVTYIGTSGGAECYSIRPMTNNEMGVSAPKTTSVSTVDIQPMSVTETTTNIYNYQEWIISSYGSYYTIANTYSATRYLSAPSSSTNGLQMIMSSSITSNAQWIFEAYTESIDRMSMVSFSDTLKIGDTFDFDAVMGSSTIGRNGGVTYSVQNTDGTATDKATINAATGVLTALKEGTVQIVTTYTNAPWLWIWNVEIKRYNFTLYGVPSYNAETGYTHDHLSALTYAQNILLNSGYDDVSIKTSNFNANSTKYILSNSAVFTIRSHGNHILDANGDVLATYVIFEDTGYICVFSAIMLKIWRLRAHI